MPGSVPAKACCTIPVRLDRQTFERFVLPCLSMPARGPRCRIGYMKVFNYILTVLYTGMQWKMLPIDKNADGKPEIHYTRVYRHFGRWSDDGSLAKFFEISVKQLHDTGLLDLSVLHGDGTNTVAKKGGDGIGFSGHKHQSLISAGAGSQAKTVHQKVLTRQVLCSGP